MARNTVALLGPTLELREVVVDLGLALLTGPDVELRVGDDTVVIPFDAQKRSNESHGGGPVVDPAAAVLAVAAPLVLGALVVDEVLLGGLGVLNVGVVVDSNVGNSAVLSAGDAVAVGGHFGGSLDLVAGLAAVADVAAGSGSGRSRSSLLFFLGGGRDFLNLGGLFGGHRCGGGCVNKEKGELQDLVVAKQFSTSLSTRQIAALGKKEQTGLLHRAGDHDTTENWSRWWVTCGDTTRKCWLHEEDTRARERRRGGVRIVFVDSRRGCTPTSTRARTHARTRNPDVESGSRRHH